MGVNNQGRNINEIVNATSKIYAAIKLQFSVAFNVLPVVFLLNISGIGIQSLYIICCKVEFHPVNLKNKSLKFQDNRMQDNSYWQANLRLIFIYLNIWFTVFLGFGLLLVVLWRKIGS